MIQRRLPLEALSGLHLQTESRNLLKIFFVRTPNIVYDYLNSVKAGFPSGPMIRQKRRVPISSASS